MDMTKHFIGILLLSGIINTTQAQNTEVTVEKKGNDKNKTVVDTATEFKIVVDGDKITINGQAIDDSDPRWNGIGNKKIRFERSKQHYLPKKILQLTPTSPLLAQNRAYLGVSTEATEDRLMIIEVLPSSPAAKAGLKKNDIITHINNEKIESPAALYEIIGQFKPLEKIVLTYIREGKKSSVEIELAANKNKETSSYLLPNSPMYKEPSNPFRFEIPDMPELDGLLLKQNNNKPKMGISIEDIEMGDGVRVKKVTTGSPAEKAGIKIDDIIIKLNDKKINEVNDLKWEYVEVGKQLYFEILRNGVKKTLVVLIPKKINSADL